MEKWQNKRNKYLKEHRELDVSGLPEETQRLLKRTDADKAILYKMTPDDLAAIFKEERGVEILNYKGEITQHLQKGEESINSIKNTILPIKARLKLLKDAGQAGSVESNILQDKLSKLSKLKDLYTELMKEAKCPTDTPKLKL